VLGASVHTAMKRPLPFVRKPIVAPGSCDPSGATLSRVVTPVTKSCVKTSLTPFVSSGTKFFAQEEKVT
jgi:hypothetical protein